MPEGIPASEMLQILEDFDPIEATRRAVEENADKMADLIRGQLIEGYDGTGNKMAPYKSTPYAKKKHEMNPLPGYGIRDLKKTGEFYKGIYAYTKPSNYVITSSDPKTMDIVNRDGKEIFGLLPSSVATFRGEVLRGALLQSLADKINGRS